MARALPILILLAACGSDPAPPPAKEADGPSASRPAPAPPAAPARDEDLDRSADAAEMLRDYYDRIERRDYEGAARLRADRTDAKRLADNFKAYRTYNVQVGAPSLPAEQAGWLYVSVPVMITGSYPNGQTFGSAGRVTLRRAAPGSAGERSWRIHTG